jgi:pyruvate dehydrogenase (quinone)
VDAPDEVGPAWEEALAADVPVLYEAVTDPEVPPLPPHISFQQARHYLSAVSGDPERGAMIKESLKQKLAQLVPGR